MNIFRQIKWFIQRGLYGFSDFDTWELYAYLTEWLPKAIRKLAKEKSSCPTKFYDASIKSDECKKWRETLIKMAEGFEAIQTLEEHHDFMIENDKVKAKKNKEILDKKVEEGFDLFKKYFRSLWD